MISRTFGQNDRQTERHIVPLLELLRERKNLDTMIIQSLFALQPVKPLRRSVAGVMSRTWIDPDTIPLPSVSALGGGLSCEDEWDQVRVCNCHNIHPRKLESLASFVKNIKFIKLNFPSHVPRLEPKIFSRWSSFSLIVNTTSD